MQTVGTQVHKLSTYSSQTVHIQTNKLILGTLLKLTLQSVDFTFSLSSED